MYRCFIKKLKISLTNYPLKQLIVFLFACFYHPDGYAKNVLTLKDAILLSIRYNPNIQSADIQRIVDKYNLRLAQFQYELQYALTVNATQSTIMSNQVRNGSDLETVVGGVNLLGSYGTQIQASFTNPWTHNFGNPRFYNPLTSITITQPLLRGFGPAITLAPLYNAEDQELINRLNLKNTAIQNITTVISQYISAVNSINTADAVKISVKQVKETYNQTKILIQEGRKSASEIVQYQSNLSSQELSLQQAELNILQTKQNLLIAIGIDPNTPIKLPKQLDDFIKNLPSRKESIDLALANNPTYQQGILNIRILKRNLAVAIDNIRPQLNLVGTRTQGGGTGGPPNSGLASLVNGTNYGTVVGVNINIPISTIPQQQAIASARVALQQAEINQAALRRQIISSVEITYASLLSQREQIKQAKLAVKYAKENFDLAQIKLKYGKISSFELNNIQTELTNANLNYLNTYASYILSESQFDSILGLTIDRWNLKITY
ncbi:TolC family protein [Fluoribacter gormanii]|uniref:TolC family protein n=1 Tax=Fluoribacter gormanii TaxID=464 RepID=UPI0013EF86D8|nr:TolC family protein [Fluoribacter gormanii]